MILCEFAVWQSLAEFNVSLEWARNKDMLTVVKMVKESDEELMKDNPITSSKLLEEQKGERKCEDFKPYKWPQKTKKKSVPWR